MKRKYIILLILLSLLSTCLIFYFIIYKSFLSNKKFSKIIVKEIKTIQTSSSTYVTVIPIASLPKEVKKESYETVEGEITLIPSDTSNPNSSKMTVLIYKNEAIVLTNSPYVNTLRKLYLDKEVILKGKWRKDAIIYGRRYRCFWVEDFEMKR